MSISDKLMWRYMEILLHTPAHTISMWQEKVAAGNAHPMEIKKQMAQDIVARFWSANDAQQARSQFEALFQKKDYSQAALVTLPSAMPNPIWIVELIKLLGAVESSSQARRLIQEGAVKINDQAMIDAKQEIKVVSGMIIKVGKHRIYRIE
jgi:tyrosyl-tRNA synthetase